MTVARTEIRVHVHRDYARGGLDNLIARVRDNSKKLAENYANNAVHHIQTYAPIRTGRLRRSAVQKRIGTYGRLIRVGAYYGVYVNYGTRYMRAQPFFEPALSYAKAIYDREKQGVFRP